MTSIKAVKWAGRITLTRGLLIGFILMTTIFSYLSWRSDANSNKISRNQHNQAIYNWNQCKRGETNTTKINKSTRVFIQLLEENNKPPNPQITRWIKIQQDSILVVPSCGKKP